MELKKWPKLNLPRYWSQVLIKSTIFTAFTFLVTVLLHHNLDSSFFNLTSLTFTKRYSVLMKNKTLAYFLTISTTICQIGIFIFAFFPILKSFILLIPKQKNFCGTNCGLSSNTTKPLCFLKSCSMVVKLSKMLIKPGNHTTKNI